MKTKLNFNTIELNNTVRKGLYLRISNKGKPTRYYKIKDQQGQIDIIRKYYTNKYLTHKGEQNYKNLEKAWQETTKKPNQRNKTLKKTIKEITSYIRKIRKKGIITQKIQRGISTIKINPKNQITNQLQNKITRTLLQNLVIDKQLLKILCKPENFNKLKNRLDYQLEARNEQNELVLQANNHGITLNQALNESHEATTQTTGTTFRQEYKENPYLKNRGWFSQTNQEGNGKPINWQLIINIRKA